MLYSNSMKILLSIVHSMGYEIHRDKLISINQL